jgi:hypothetical protein
MAQPTELLERARAELIDLSSRSRLLHVRLDGRANQLRIVGEDPRQVLARLVGDGGHFGFLPRVAAPDGARGSPAEEQPADEEVDRADGHLQTTLDDESLAKRLLRLANADRTNREEIGIGALHLAVGFLQWPDPADASIERTAPLVLVPVALERANATVPFRLRATGEELPSNVSLQAKLKRDFAIELPELPFCGEVDPEHPAAAFDAMIERVRAAIAGRPGFTVRDGDLVLGFFSFTKFLMWRDLDARTWPESSEPARRPDRHPLVAGLLGRALPPTAEPLCDDEAPLDRFLPPESLGHVVDADSSQAQVVAEAIDRRRSLVVQGPPGTGKSQTITNIVAAAVAKGLRVLFIAEKLAALSVVKARLDAVGLGPACLELHSTKATRRGVLDELSRTLELGPPKASRGGELAAAMRNAAEILARHGTRLHHRDATNGRTAAEAIAALAELESSPELVDAAAERPLRIDGVERWSTAVFEERAARFRDAVGRIAAWRHAPQEHPFRGATVRSLLPAELQAATRRWQAARAALGRCAARAAELAALLGASDGAHTSICELGGVAAAAAALRSRPPCDAARFTDEVWRSQSSAIETLVQDVEAAAAARRALRDRATAAAIDADHALLRKELAETGTAWLRFLMPRWRRADAAYRAIVVGTPDKDLARRLALLDEIAAARMKSGAVRSRDALGRAAFGSAWRGPDSDAEALAATVRWYRDATDAIGRCGLDPARAALVAAKILGRPPEGTERAAELVPSIAEDRALVEEAFASVGLDPGAAFGCGVRTVVCVPLEDLAARLDAWIAEPDSLRDWIGWMSAAAATANDGFGAFIAAVTSGDLSAERAIERMQHSFWTQVLGALDAEGELLRADGAELDRATAAFAAADESKLKTNRGDVALAHYGRVPKAAQARGAAAAIGQVAVILRECAKQRRHLPIRRLLAEAGQAVQAIKPVFMMSPVSIARFLEPGALEFDVLVVDEASQVRPVEALGAFARLAPNATIVVVGDEKQLPPTQFFLGESRGDDDIDEDDDGAALGDLESLLGACEAAGVPRRMLRWHYRSKHHSLIAISNRTFYRERLRIIPSPGPPDASLGLRMRRIDGVYDRGGTRTNPIEAEAVARAVLEHARTTPELSLGVAAFSVQQRDAIIDAIERARREDPSCEEFFAAEGDALGGGPREPFFVKNLENVQGDERDVVFVSVGYGRDASGGLAMNFGPVSAAGGERRLNVLMTRAKRRCEIFSSIGAEDIDPARASGEGPAALRAFLAAAAKGEEGAPLAPAGSDHAPIADGIVAFLRSRGLAAAADVGVAGLFIDVAVEDPDRGGRFLVAVETDGPAWSKARTARDRDRIRPSVLRDRGWHLHRIWAVDWWLRRSREEERLLAAIEAARIARRREEEKAAAASREAAALRVVRPAPQPMVDAVERLAPSPTDAAGDLNAIAMYRELRTSPVRLPQGVRVQDLPAEILALLVEAVVRVEGPIHVDELSRRVVRLAGGTRATAPAVDAVAVAVRVLAGPEHRTLVLDGPFISIAGRGPIEPRRRDEAESSGLRDPSMLPPAETAVLVARVAAAHIGVARAEAIVECRRRFGFAGTGARVREAMEAGIERALADGLVVERDGRLFAAT